MPEKMIVYVDGFNLYHGIHSKWGRRFLWLDLVALSKAIRPRSTLVKVKYFTASVLNEPDAQARQNVYIAALQSVNRGLMETIYGRYQEKSRICFSCGKVSRLYEEKETDVNIAINILADAAAHAADSFIIVSGDSDIAPAVRMARAINPSAFFAAAFPPSRVSFELQKLMPQSFVIGRAKIAQSLLPEIIYDENGLVTQTRPEKWV